MNPENDITAFYRVHATGEPPQALDSAILRAARREHGAARELGTLAAIAATLLVAVVLSTPMGPAPKTSPNAAAWGGIQVRDFLLTMKVNSIESPPGYSTPIYVSNFAGENP